MELNKNTKGLITVLLYHLPVVRGQSDGLGDGRRTAEPPIRGGQRERKERGEGSFIAAISRESSAVGTSSRSKQLQN